jgi:hypothetical protein
MSRTLELDLETAWKSIAKVGADIHPLARLSYRDLALPHGSCSLTLITAFRVAFLLFVPFFQSINLMHPAPNIFDLL